MFDSISLSTHALYLQAQRMEVGQPAGIHQPYYYASLENISVSMTARMKVTCHTLLIYLQGRLECNRAMSQRESMSLMVLIKGQRSNYFIYIVLLLAWLSVYSQSLEPLLYERDSSQQLRSLS